MFVFFCEHSFADFEPHDKSCAIPSVFESANLRLFGFSPANLDRIPGLKIL